MNTKLTFAALLAAIPVALGSELRGDDPPRESFGAEPFTSLDFHLEVDVADLAAEVVLVFEAEVGVEHLALFDPAGVPVTSLRAADLGGLGVTEATIQSGGIPLAELLEIYPAGEYTVRATTVSGIPLVGSVHLSHVFPSRFRVVSPSERGTLRKDAAILDWNPSAGATGYFLEIEQDDLEFSLEITLPATMTDFTIPGNLLKSGVTYEYSLTAQGDNDNETEIEGTFLVQN